MTVKLALVVKICIDDRSALHTANGGTASAGDNFSSEQGPVKCHAVMMQPNTTPDSLTPWFVASRALHTVFETFPQAR